MLSVLRRVALASAGALPPHWKDVVPSICAIVQVGGRVARLSPPVRWVVGGCAGLVLVHRLLPLPPAVTGAAGLASVALLTVALGALGLETDLRALRAKGLRPLALAGAAWLFIAGFSLVLVRAVV